MIALGGPAMAVRKLSEETLRKNRERARQWALDNRERKRAGDAERYRADPGRRAQLGNEWRSNNRERSLELQRKHNRARRERPEVRLHNRVASGIRRCLRDQKSRAVFDLLDYSVAELRAHLERQFLPGMGWHNMGQWHIDHIVPLSSFTITGESDPGFKRAWDLPNLRPLWGQHNVAKGARRETLL